MIFDNGTWWLFAGMVGGLVLIVGFLLTLLINHLIIKPAQEFRDSVKAFEMTISDFKSFIKVQEGLNSQGAKDVEHIEKTIEKIDGRVTKVEKETTDQRHKLNTVLQILDIKGQIL